MKRRREKALSLAEVLAALVIVIGLAYLALPFVVGAFSNDGRTQSLSNMKQLLMATQQMAIDNERTPEAGWPGDTDGTFSTWSRNLVEGGYLTTNDFRKLLSANGRMIKPDETPTMSLSAVLVYAVKNDSPGSTVFLTTANFTNSPTGGVRPSAKAKPYGAKGFVVMHRDGGGAILQARQAGNTNLIGGFAPLCR